MNKSILTMFVIGAATGSVATWFYLKKHYEKIIQQEIDSVKSIYANRNAVLYSEVFDKPEKKSSINTSPTEEDEISDLKSNVVRYAAELQRAGYINYNEQVQKNTNEKKDDDMTEKPYIITPDEFEYEEDFITVSLTYYEKDKILADYDDEIIEDIDNTVGNDFSQHFGEYEEDVVYIRNERLKYVYEICRDIRSYDEVTGLGRH